MIAKRLLPLFAVPAAALSLSAAFLLRFDFWVPPAERAHLRYGLFIFVAAKTLVFLARGARRGLVTAGALDFLRLAFECLAASALSIAALLLLLGPVFPPSVYPVDALVFFPLMASVLANRRLRGELSALRSSAGIGKPILVYGAGAAGVSLVKELAGNPRLGYQVVGFLDDDPAKRGASLAGVPVVAGGRDAAMFAARQRRRGAPLSEIVIAMPSASGGQMRTAVANCRAAGVPVKTVPGVAELLEGKVLTQQIREVNVNDLLARDSVPVSEDLVAAGIESKCVMVVGGCGVVGAELCRQIGRFKPRRLVIFDRAETPMLTLALDLRGRFPKLELVTEIGDAASYPRVFMAMSRNGVDAVFHSAGYARVPLMEAHLLEASGNNVLGAFNVARAAYETNGARLILVSTDKAANPGTVVGVTKRAAEVVVSAMPLGGGARNANFASVRFGNVLDGDGAVVNLFRKQIEAGGPVAVTHPEMRRRFIGASEAALLVLQCYAMAKGGEIFVLDMGDPVLISDLARNMIQLAGLAPESDIKIEHTGLRPGENLEEENAFDAPNLSPTAHKRIKAFHPSAPTRYQLTPWVEELRVLIRAGEPLPVKAHLLQLISR